MILLLSLYLYNNIFISNYGKKKLLQSNQDLMLIGQEYNTSKNKQTNNNTYRCHQKPPLFPQVDLIVHPSLPSSSCNLQTSVHFLLWFVCP